MRTQSLNLQIRMNKKPEIDIVDKVLDYCYKGLRMDVFVMSLMHQYEERGSLSKKQLQGLYFKAQKVKDMPPNLLATLEARINKMPNRFKSDVVKTTEVKEADTSTEDMINAILAKYPQHKRVIFFQSKHQHKEALTPAEIKELEKFAKLLL